MKSSIDLVAAIEKANNALEGSFASKESEAAAECKKQALQAVKKARLYKFYLGMDKGWLYV